ncbi:uncharacterized protein At4g06744-like [Malania oleifera]|uniref:uncharacterized protein At4g06744-like n=1 Tax=Malania oleifera TaxID=397392 RepID=UPI0025ADE928|nr:uncharacterized protein At4g06744-like [Malania oleifera]
MAIAFLFLIIISLLQCPCHVQGTNNINAVIQALTGISLPPVPAPAPSPHPCLNDSTSQNVLLATKNLRQNITNDPQNFTSTWEGCDYCSFMGYYCDIVPDKNTIGLTSIDFNHANFSGNLVFDDFIQNLKDVAIFHISSNNFSGPISSSSISNLRYLDELDLSNNNFAGEFPKSLLGAAKLTFLDLRFNQFSGLIPAELFDMDIRVLFLNDNDFSGRIPDNLGNTSALYLSLANNNFSGGIPRSIGHAPNLLEVLFQNNKLNGCLPYEVGFLSNLTLFNVGSNWLTGPIPKSFGCLASVNELVLADNEFYGEVPDTLCMLPNLTNLDLSGNFFTSVGPICRKLFFAGMVNATMNCISELPDQRSGSDCTAFAPKSKYSCPYESTFSIVPCDASSSSKGIISSVAAMEVERGGPKRTYAALKRNSVQY